MELLFKSTPRCSYCNSMVSLEGKETVVAHMKLDRRTNQEHYYCDKDCFYSAMDKVSKCVEISIRKIIETSINRFDVICKEIKVEFLR